MLKFNQKNKYNLNNTATYTWATTRNYLRTCPKRNLFFDKFKSKQELNNLFRIDLEPSKAEPSYIAINTFLSVFLMYN